MTRITDSIELDFCDVLFKPKRTTLNSRREADVIRKYKFKYYPQQLMSCGIMASNMATTGTFEINNVLQKYQAITCLHKHYDFKNDENYQYISQNYDKEESAHNAYTFITTGLRDDKEQLFALLAD